MTVLITFLLGMMAVVPAMYVETKLDYFFSNIASSQRIGYSIIDSFVFTGLIEEFFKWLIILLYIWRHKDYDDTFDGIVYSVHSSLGFAVLENIFYIYSFDIQTALIRAFCVGHFLFGVFMGYYLSKAKCNFYRNNKKLKNKYLALSLIIPTVLHGLYDFLLDRNIIFLVVFCIFYIGIIILSFWLVKCEIANDHSMNKESHNNGL